MSSRFGPSALLRLALSAILPPPPPPPQKVRIIRTRSDMPVDMNHRTGVVVGSEWHRVYPSSAVYEFIVVQMDDDKSKTTYIKQDCFVAEDGVWEWRW
jgi:hypothetical protein